LTSGFKDHFSTQSGGYARYRPTYPAALFEFLADITAGRRFAWDCATGNGQAALALSRHFDEVIATDASQAQIEAALPRDRIDYRVASAEQSGLDDGSIDLVTVGQAFHWFDESAFFDEVRRVTRDDGVLAIWSYEQCVVSKECDALVATLYGDIVDEYWPPERALVEQGYSDVEMPGQAIEVPDFRMSLDWTASDMLGYLRTWSACKRYQADKGKDPVAIIETSLNAAWGTELRRVVWPLTTKASRPNTR
jgi:SAM-dependent methyltransferase